MAGKFVESDIAKLAEFLIKKKDNGSSCVLFLGSRVGGLFRSQHFIAALKVYGKDFNLLSQAEQFAECYKIVDSGRFSEADLHSLLTISLEGLNFTERDMCLAEMVESGFFNTIITTNIDNTLEQALTDVGIHEFQDLAILISERDILPESFSSAKKQLIKVFGDFPSRSYNIMQRHSYLENHKTLRNLLEKKLRQDVIVIGFDPVWDAELLDAFIDLKSSLWIVSEEEISSQHPFTKLANLHNINFKYITGRDGIYKYFARELHFQIHEHLPLNYQMIRDTLNLLRQMSDDFGMLVGLRKVIDDIENKQLNHVNSEPIGDGALTPKAQEFSSTDQ